MDAAQDLREMVAVHTIRYEIWPHLDIQLGEPVKDGFDLELHGTHDHGHSRMTPGCHLCQQSFRDLQTVAESILPKDARPSSYEIPPFDNTLHAKAGGELEVVLTICIRHRKEYFGTVDPCEERCLHEMIDNLTLLGVVRGKK